MTLQRPNPTPRFAASLAALLPPAEACRIVDIGSRNGIEKIWTPLGAAAHFIGFEADPDEAARLNVESAETEGGSTIRHLPFALSDCDGERLFRIARFGQCSSFYAADPDWIGRFPVTEQDTVREVMLPTRSLDSVCRAEGYDRIDFIKIDVEGAELDILKGAAETLADRHVLGVKTEFWWDPPVKRDYAASFAEIDIYLRGHGFRFFDIKPHYYPRATIPSGRLTGQFDNPEAKARLGYRHFDYGQAFTGDALYFRDPVAAAIAGAPLDGWPAPKLLRLCALMDLFDYGDAGIEILEHLGDRIAAVLPDSTSLDALYDLLTPTLDGEILSYAAYREIAIAHRRAYRKTWLGLEDWAPPPTRYGKR